jgi:hypothetical protein
VHLAHVAERTRLHQFDQAPRAVVGMTLVAHLRHHLRLLRHLAHQARFPDRMRQRLLTINVLAQSHRHHRGVGVMMIRRAHGDRLDLLHLLEHLSVVAKQPRPRKFRAALLQPFPVHVAQRHDVLARTPANVRRCLPARANGRDVQLSVRGNAPRLAGRTRRRISQPLRQQQPRGERSGSEDKAAAIDANIVGGHGSDFTGRGAVSQAC